MRRSTSALSSLRHMPFAIPEPPRRDGRTAFRLRVLAIAGFLVVLPLAGASGQDSILPPPRDVQQPGDLSARPVGGLRPGDLLKIAVYRDKELSGEYLIDSRGYVQIPGLGNILVVGLDPTQARDQLIAALMDRGFSAPEIAVQALIRVSVLGEVRTPGLQPVEPGSSLLQVVTIAGGPTDRADLSKTQVVRDGRAFRVDLESGLEGSAAGRVVLYSNDIVVVPKRTGLTRENLGFIIGGVSAALTLVNLVLTIQRN